MSVMLRFLRQVEEVGNILIAVRNLGEQCYLSHYGPLDGMDAATMMDMIKVPALQ